MEVKVRKILKELDSCQGCLEIVIDFLGKRKVSCVLSVIDQSITWCVSRGFKPELSMVFSILRMMMLTKCAKGIAKKLFLQKGRLVMDNYFFQNDTFYLPFCVTLFTVVFPFALK